VSRAELLVRPVLNQGIRIEVLQRHIDADVVRLYSLAATVGLVPQSVGYRANHTMLINDAAKPRGVPSSISQRLDLSTWTVSCRVGNGLHTIANKAEDDCTRSKPIHDISTNLTAHLPFCRNRIKSFND
jgi:hypothetical protein